MKKLVSVLGCILTVSWMLVIFYFSSKSGTALENHKSFLLNFMIRIFQGNRFSSYPLDEQSEIVKRYSFYISKTAHFLEYGILCYFCFLIFFYLKKYYLRYIISLIICLLYAFSDEYHQTFSSGRTPRALDVMIDFLGAVAMVLLLELIITWIYIIRRGRTYD